MVTNINKLFSEKIDIFSPVETHKSDILMCVVKIGLRVRFHQLPVFHLIPVSSFLKYKSI